MGPPETEGKGRLKTLGGKPDGSVAGFQLLILKELGHYESAKVRAPRRKPTTLGTSAERVAGPQMSAARGLPADNQLRSLLLVKLDWRALEDSPCAVTYLLERPTGRTFIKQRVLSCSTA